VEKLDLVTEYSKESVAQLIKELKSRSFPHSEVVKRENRPKRRSVVLGHAVLFVALAIVSYYFVLAAMNYLSDALDQAALLDEVYRSQWIHYT
jgi:hypothetical protein